MHSPSERKAKPSAPSKGHEGAATRKIKIVSKVRHPPYDPVYELTKVMQGATTKESYTYDAVGNRTYQPGAPYTYNSSNEMLTREGVPYTYDANGTR
jgi:YD repeat-containing protein